MKHADAFAVEVDSSCGRPARAAIICRHCGNTVTALRDGRPWREVAAVVKNHVCPQLRAALDTPPVLVGQATLSNELGPCNSAYRPRTGHEKTVVLCSGHHEVDAETHAGSGYIWQDTEAENYS